MPSSTALSSKRIAGAALDVFVSEPPTDSPLLGLDNISLTPHLGASTDEAQEKAGVSVAQSVRLALDGELVPDAVNVAGGIINTTVRPGIPLMEKLGQVFSGLADGPITSVDVEVRGEIAEFDVSVLKLAALKGIFTNIVSEAVSYVNAPLLAEQRGIPVRLITDAVSDEYRNLLTIRGGLGDGTQVSVSGTLTGTKQIEKIVEINGYDVEVPVNHHLIVMVYTDRPGIVAVFGQEFGDAGINIAGMQVSRREAGGQALSVLTIDSPAPEGLLESRARQDRRRPDPRDRHHRVAAGATKPGMPEHPGPLFRSARQITSSCDSRSVTRSVRAGSTAERVVEIDERRRKSTTREMMNTIAPAIIRMYPTRSRSIQSTRKFSANVRMAPMTKSTMPLPIPMVLCPFGPGPT